MSTSHQITNMDVFYPAIVQRAIMAMCKVYFGPRFKTYRVTPMMQVQPTDLPVLGIYMLRQKSTPWGNANHAEPKFRHEAVYGFSAGIHAETADQNQIYALEDTVSEMLNMVFSRPALVNLMEGFEAMDRTSQYAKVGETTLYEIRVEVNASYEGNYPPIVDDLLEKIVVTTQFPDKEHVDDGTPQLTRVYELDQGT